MTDNLFTRGQLKRKISQEIQSFYCRHLGHRPTKVSCKIFEGKLAIIVEDSITSAEQILVEEGKTDLARKVRSNLDNAIEPELKLLIEKITDVKIIDFLSDATFSTRRTGIIAILSNTPKVKNPYTIPKVRNV